MVEEVQTLEKEGTRSVLLRAAAEEFAELGYNGLRIQGIVKRRGSNDRRSIQPFSQ